VAVSGFYDQIRKSTDPNIKGYVSGVITEVAKEYGAREMIDNSILKECIRLVVGSKGHPGKFGMIGLSEIREAYRQWASGEIQVKGGEMYGGSFNAAQFGKVLTAYLDKRKQVIAAFTTLKREQEWKEAEQRRDEKWKSEYEENFEKYLQECTAESWKEIPIHWYDTAMRRGLIDFEKGEAVLIYEEAKGLAKAELISEMQNVENIFQKAGWKTQMESGEWSEDRAKVIARKITVFRKLTQNGIDSRANRKMHPGANQVC